MADEEVEILTADILRLIDAEVPPGTPTGTDHGVASLFAETLRDIRGRPAGGAPRHTDADIASLTAKVETWICKRVRDNPPTVTAEDLRSVGFPPLDEHGLADLNARLTTYVTIYWQNQILSRGKPSLKALHGNKRQVDVSKDRIRKAAKTLTDEVFHARKIGDSKADAVLGDDLRRQLKAKGHDLVAGVQLLFDIQELSEVVADDRKERRDNAVDLSGVRKPELELIEGIGIAINAVDPRGDGLFPSVSTRGGTNNYSGPRTRLGELVLKRLGLNVTEQRVGTVWHDLTHRNPSKNTGKYWLRRAKEAGGIAGED